AQRDLTIETVNPLVITTTSLPVVTSGQGFSFGLTSTGGKGTKTWSVASGSLPAGVSLDPATGVLSGLSNAVGLFPFTAQVTDQTSPPQAGIQALTLALAPVLSLTVQPTDVAVDEAVVPGVKALAQDGSGAVVPGLTLTLAIGSSDGTTNMYGSTSALTGPAGIATFPNVRFDTAAAVTLKAQSLGGSSPESGFFSIFPLFKSVLDPAGDAGAGNPDLVQADAIRNGNGMSFNVIFSAAGFDPATSSAQIGLDLDQDVSTGHPGVTADGQTDGNLLGSEIIINFGSAFYGSNAEVLKYTGPPINTFTFVGTVPKVDIANGYQVTVPLSMLGNDDGRVNFKVTSSMQISPTGFTGVLDVLPDVGSAPGHVDNILIDQAEPVARTVAAGYSIFTNTATSTFQDLAQVITPGVTGNLREVRVPVSACSAVGLIAEIRTLVGGLPKGSVLASQTVPGSAFPPAVLTSQFTRVVFDTPAAVTSGTPVAIVLRSTGQCNMADGPLANAYPGGDAYFRSDGTPSQDWVLLGPTNGVFDLPFLTIAVAPVIP
ncbi:MAG TPA: Ig domain-containing protein, partial [Gemmatimonadales bacterium]|nr:Ig domain-containing protein [Gemmatimonadales bacterium]